MKKTKKILISGAGIAGPTLAYWLGRNGFDITVIERAPELRRGGQNIDISDAAVEIARKMGIEQQILDHNTTEIGLRFVNERNETEAEFPKGGATSFTRRYEILRGDLAEILFEKSRSFATYRFGEEIESLNEVASSVSVRFRSGKEDSFDLVIGADGVSSAARSLILAEEKAPYCYLGVFTSYFTLPKRPTDSKWARWYNAPGGKVFLLRPDNKGSTRASLNFWHEANADEHFNREEAIAKLRSVLKDAGWEAPRIARDLEKDPDIYLGPVSQVRLPRWWKGRCALVGDAAYCPTPFTGMGTTLAIIGAYVLAGELAQAENHEQAFGSYEEKLRPFVEKVQRVFPGQFRLVYPQSKWGVKALNKVAGFVASKAVQKLFARLGSSEEETPPSFKLPEYAQKAPKKPRSA